MKKNYILLHATVLVSSVTGIFGKVILLNEGLIVWYRVLFSAIFLFLIVRFMKIDLLKDLKSKWDVGKIGVVLIAHWLFFYASVKYANVSIAGVCFCLTSFFTAILKPLLDRTKFQVSEFLLSCLTLLGVLLIFHFDTSYRIGIVCGAISSLLAALYTIFNGRLTNKYESTCITYYQMIGGTLGLAVILPFYLHFFPSERFLPTPSETTSLLFLSLVCTVGMYIAITYVLKNISPFTVNLTFNLKLVYSILFAFALLGEASQVTIHFYMGLALIVLSVVIQTLISVRANKQLSKS